MTLADTFFDYFSDVKDPRIQNHNFRHRILDILVITVLATICGADGWAEIERLANQNKIGLNLFLNYQMESHLMILLVVFSLY